MENGTHPHIYVESLEDLTDKLSDQWWRLNNLYYIIDESGQKVLFQPNYAQERLFHELHIQNLILKARQLGFTTFIDILFLDICLFNSETEAGIIAHNREDAGKIFRRKIQYPYHNLPAWLQERISVVTESKSEISFSNGSLISVGTSMRSGTVQLLHISEFGKICARFPDKAREIVTGTMEAIHPGSPGTLTFIESTAEGRAGYFYAYCKKAQDDRKAELPLTPMDMKFHFFPWWQHPKRVLDPAGVIITTEMQQYFSETETLIGQRITPEQRAWYVKKAEKLGEDMKREHPSTPEEAFEQSIKGAYYASEFDLIRKEKRITRIPVEPGVPVQVAWDLGISDYMCLWFFQQIGREVRWIDYYENEGEGLPFYFKVMQDKGYFYGEQHLPHDAKVRELRDGKSREEKFVSNNFRTVIAPQLGLAEGIDEVRKILRMSWFDEERCATGIVRLEGYRKSWDDKQGCFKDRPEHDVNSHGADAFRIGAININFKPAAKPPGKRRRRTGMAV